MTEPKRGRGLVRPQINIDPQTESEPVVLEEKKVVEENRKTTDYANQKAQIKLSEGLKNECNAIKQIFKKKYDYEVLELLIDSFVESEMTPSQKKTFKTLKDL